MGRKAFANSTTIIATTTSVTAMTSTAVAITTGATNSTTSSPGSCPVTYAPTPTWVSYNTTTDCEVAQYGTTLYYDYLDPCVKTYCENMWNRSVSSYEAGTGELYTTTRTYNQGIYGTGSLSTVITAESYSTTTGTYTKNIGQAYTAQPPCCSRCFMSAQTIQFFYWPDLTSTAAPTPTLSPKNATVPPNGTVIYVDPDSDFTFISPSVYMAFTSLGATDLCGVVGDTYYNTTIAFNPDEISTMEPFISTGSCTFTDSVGLETGTLWSQPAPKSLNYANLAQNCSTISGYQFFTSAWYNYLQAGDPCNPVMAIPDKVKSLQPAWVSCEAGYNGGFYDPPKTLTQGSLLVPTASPAPAPPTAAPATSIPAVSNTRPSSAAAPPPASPSPSVADPGTSQDPAPSENPASSQDPGTVPPASSAGVPDQSSAGSPGTNVAGSSAAPVPGPGTSGGAGSLAGSSPAANSPPAQSSGAAGGDSITFILTPPAVSTPAGVQASSAAAVLPVITVGGTTITANPSNTQFTIGSQTLAPGSAITVGGTSISLAPSGTAIVIGSQTVPLTAAPAPAPSQAPQVITVGGSTITANSASQFVLPGDTTLEAGGSTVTINSTPVAIMPGGASVVIGSQTVALTTPPALAPAQTPPVIAVGGSTITANSASQFVLPGGTTLSAGGSTVTINGTPVAILSGGSSVVVGSTTRALVPTAAPSITVAGAIVTPNSSGQYVVSGTTLAVNGPALTVSGTTYKLTTNTAGQTALIVGATNSAATISVAAVTSTAPATSATGAVSEIAVSSGASSSSDVETTTSSGLGGLIMSGLGGAGSTGASSTQAHPTGGVGSLSMAMGGWFAASLAAFVGMLAL